MMTEVCCATSHIMMMVGWTTNSMHGTTNVVRVLLGNRYVTVYFMMRSKLLYMIEGCIQCYQSYDDGGLTMEVYGATCHMIMEVGTGASHMMKLCGANESMLIVSYNLTFSLVRDMRWYI